MKAEAPKCKTCGERHWHPPCPTIRAQARLEKTWNEINVSRETFVVNEGVKDADQGEPKPGSETGRYDWDARERELGLRK